LNGLTCELIRDMKTPGLVGVKCCNGDQCSWPGKN
jgi:hypothetical protein